jgi:carboxylesterase type B
MSLVILNLYALKQGLYSCTEANDTLSCLRAADVDLLQQANVDLNDAGFQGTFVFVPVVDGDLITQQPSQALAQGKVNGVSLHSRVSRSTVDLLQ